VQFLLFCCFDEAKWNALPAPERNQIMLEYQSLVQELRQTGRLRGGAKLDACSTALSVRRRKGEPVIVDGPFAETKEQVGGYHLIECRDRDEALAIALRIPTLAAGGVVEVRPVLHLE
jgi:hypothetical protein